jgi:hypothetical protein
MAICSLNGARWSQLFSPPSGADNGRVRIPFGCGSSITIPPSHRETGDRNIQINGALWRLANTDGHLKSGQNIST